MRIIHGRTVVEDDWRHVPDGEPLPADGRATVSLARWRSLISAPEPVMPRGVRLAPGDPVEALADSLSQAALVAVEFGAHTEGRGFSYARLLREQLGYVGEIRATGVVTRDRLAFMARCGFDAFELREGEALEDALAAFDELPLRYQPAADGGEIVAQRRGWRAA
jgi:uncharacterized protein (DUF934 family)